MRATLVDCVIKCLHCQFDHRFSFVRFGIITDTEILKLDARGRDSPLELTTLSFERDRNPQKVDSAGSESTFTRDRVSIKAKHPSQTRCGSEESGLGIEEAAEVVADSRVAEEMNRQPHGRVEHEQERHHVRRRLKRALSLPLSRKAKMERQGKTM